MASLVKQGVGKGARTTNGGVSALNTIRPKIRMNVPNTMPTQVPLRKGTGQGK